VASTCPSNGDPMQGYPKAISGLIDELRKLPGIGPKTAQRLAFHMVVSGKSSIDLLINSLAEVRDTIGYCSVCGNLTDIDPCAICQAPDRDASIICVVGYPKDVLAIERVGGYKGLFHVLHGYIEPLKGVGPDDIRVKELIARVKHNAGQVKEVILATNPDIDGETTALYLARVLKPLGVKVTRLARGLPFGADLDYADEVTLSRALEGRSEM
jgi:recombination protein RecR